MIVSQEKVQTWYRMEDSEVTVLMEYWAPVLEFSKKLFRTKEMVQRTK